VRIPALYLYLAVWAVHSDLACIFIHKLLFRASRKSTSRTPSPLRIAQRQECPAELEGFEV